MVMAIAFQPGTEGVMWVRGHSSAPLYWNRPDNTADTMRGDWIYTGDRFLERDGYYYFQGRADDLVKVSGQWVWPLEVERCLGRTRRRARVCPLSRRRWPINARRYVLSSGCVPVKPMMRRKSNVYRTLSNRPCNRTSIHASSSSWMTFRRPERVRLIGRPCWAPPSAKENNHEHRANRDARTQGVLRADRQGQPDPAVECARRPGHAGTQIGLPAVRLEV